MIQTGETAFQQVLLLNASFEPLNVINWKRALKLVFLEKVEVLEESDQAVHSATCELRVPQVIRLLRFVGFRKRDVKFSRENIYARDKYRCQYCYKKIPAKELTIDHVLPRSRGGGTTWENIVSCCKPCNRRKGGRTPEEANFKLRREPYTPSWLHGFRARFAVRRPPESWRDYMFWGPIDGIDEGKVMVPEVGIEPTRGVNPGGF